MYKHVYIYDIATMVTRYVCVNISLRTTTHNNSEKNGNMYEIINE